MEHGAIRSNRGDQRRADNGPEILGKTNQHQGVQGPSTNQHDAQARQAIIGQMGTVRPHPMGAGVGEERATLTVIFRVALPPFRGGGE